MALNYTLLLEIGIIIAVLTFPLILHWARNKTNDPIVTTIFGIIIKFVPIFNLVFLLLLFNKPDLIKKQ